MAQIKKQKEHINDKPEMTDKEKKERSKKRAAWLASISEEQRDRYKMKHYMALNRGKCEICSGDREYANIYTHLSSKRHLQKVYGENDENRLLKVGRKRAECKKKYKRDTTGVCEVCNKKLYADIYAHRKSKKHGINVEKEKARANM